MTRVLFIRHGDRDNDATSINALIPLTQRGHVQASAAGKFIASLGGDRPAAVYASPFLRCLQTAEALCSELDMTYTVWASICEALAPRHFKEDPTRYYRFVSDPESFSRDFPRATLGRELDGHPACPEARDSFQSRAKASIDFLHHHHRGETVICVTHGCFLEYFAPFCSTADPSSPPFIANLGIADVLIGAGYEDILSGPLGLSHGHIPAELLSGYSFCPN
jgi:broad specificity phosphatase PhoE